MRGLFLGLGVVVFLVAGLYQLLLATGFFNDQWGVIGVVALWIFPPLWFAAPFVMWAVSGVFPATYFMAWAIGWFGGGLLFSIGSSRTEPSHASGSKI